MTIEDSSWVKLVPSVLKPAVYMYKYRKIIQEYWVKGKINFGAGSPSVLITGINGAGKSVLASHYHGEAYKSFNWTLPNASSSTEIKPISIGNWVKIVAVIPGQNYHERHESFDNVSGGINKIDGVIHVVDWGYTLIRSKGVQNDMVKLKKIDSIDDLRRHNLKQELDEFKFLLNKLIVLIKKKKGPKWLVIAVNKVDLFENDITAAEQYYHPSCESDFTKLIHDFYKIVGKQNIKIVSLPVCSLNVPFSWNGKKIDPQILDTIKLKNYMRHFIENVSLIQNETN